MDINKYLFRDEALRGEKLALKFRWILIIVVLAFVILTYLRGDTKEASFALIPSAIFLCYNLLLTYFIKIGRNIYSLRYLSVTLDILILTVHIYINSVFFSDIAVSTTASIFIYPILMFLSVLRYDKNLIVYATLLSIALFNLNYYLRLNFIDPQLIEQVISSDPIGHAYKSGYLLLMGVFFLQIPELVHRYISKQKESLLKKNKIELDLAIEQKEKGLLKTNYQLFENLLQWARSKSGELPLKKELINLSMFISSLQEQFKEALDAKKIEIEILVEDDLEVLADRYMLESIVKNLINNAVKFTPEEGKIEIDAVAGKNNVLLSIRDTGIGIPEESLKDVFSVGANIHSSGTNNEKGSGFGLILCKELIRRNGGNIFVKSKPGEGSVFSITLPHS